MEYVFEFAAKSGLDGSYLEFGTYMGASFVQAHQAYTRWLDWAESARAGQNPAVPPEAARMQRHPMWAFDSFAGLPELASADVHPGYRFVSSGLFAFSEDQFLARLRENGMDSGVVRTVPGWFDQVLTPETRNELGLGTAMVVNIDCDLYSSAVPVLQFIQPLLEDGSVLMFDDFLLYRGDPRFGVRRAFREWLEQSGMTAEPYMQYGWAGRVFLIYR